jgi:hypothetical protein
MITIPSLFNDDRVNIHLTQNKGILNSYWHNRSSKELNKNIKEIPSLFYDDRVNTRLTQNKGIIPSTIGVLMCRKLQV